MIYIISDWHFNHNKNFVYESRGYKTVEEMNNIIITNHNNIVKSNDDVYVLGDLILGEVEKGLECVQQLSGRLHLVRGNHDTDRKWETYKTLSNVVEMQNAIYLNYKKYHFYLSHFPTITSSHDYDKPLRQRTLNLCGHTHTIDKWSDFDNGYIYHCECDCQDCTPICLDQIIEDFKKVYITIHEIG